MTHTDRARDVGRNGEEMAARHLQGKGMRIIARNVRFGRGEIDIVAKDGPEWVFVEVKTRTSGRMGRAAEALTPRKTARMERAVGEYLHLNGLHEARVRCDLVAIDLAPDGIPEINHYRAAFTWK